MTYPNVQLLINNEWRAARGGATCRCTTRRRQHHWHGRQRPAPPISTTRWPQRPRVLKSGKTRPRSNAQKVMRAAAAAAARAYRCHRHRDDDGAGKPLAEAKIEIGMSCDIIEWFAEESRRVYGRIVSPRCWRSSRWC